MAWITAQQLCLLKIRARLDGDTDPSWNFERSKERAVTQEIANQPQFGFTLGISKNVAQCFVDAADVVDQVRLSGMNEMTRRRVEALSVRLRECTTAVPAYTDSTSRDKKVLLSLSLPALHDHIYALGILIRVHRCTFNPPPRELLMYTTPLFHAVAWYKLLNPRGAGRAAGKPYGSGPIVWPVLQAAFELYLECDQDRARELWLNEFGTSTTNPAGGGGENDKNREDIKTLVEAVWDRRRKRAIESNEWMGKGSGNVSLAKQGDIVIDFREVRKDLGLQIPPK